MVAGRAGHQPFPIPRSFPHRRVDTPVALKALSAQWGYPLGGWREVDGAAGDAESMSVATGEQRQGLARSPSRGRGRRLPARPAPAASGSPVALRPPIAQLGIHSTGEGWGLRWLHAGRGATQAAHAYRTAPQPPAPPRSRPHRTAAHIARRADREGPSSHRGARAFSVSYAPSARGADHPAEGCGSWAETLSSTSSDFL